MPNSRYIHSTNHEQISSYNHSFINELKAAQTRLYNILKIEYSKFDEKRWLSDFNSFCQNYKRFFYDCLTSSIFAEDREETRQCILDNLQKVIDSCKIEDFSSFGDQQQESKNKELLIKFYDHVNLACIQKQQITTNYDIENQLDRIRSTDIPNMLKAETANITTSITNQLIGLVTLFTALSFVIFASISGLSTMFNGLTSEKLPLIALAGLIWFLSMTLVFFVFCCLIIKITKPKLSLSKVFTNRVFIAIAVAFVALCVTLVISSTKLQPKTVTENYYYGREIEE